MPVHEAAITDRGARMTRVVLNGYQPQAQRALREAKGWSPEKLGRYADVSGDTVRNWEQGKSTPTVNKLYRVSLALECQMSDLVKVPVDERRLEDWRNVSGLLQADVAAKLGDITTAAYGKIERGASPLTRVEKLSELFKASPEQLREAWTRSRRA
jgi:transcriptional regulator with XRE-family HTH domain